MSSLLLIAKLLPELMSLVKMFVGMAEKGTEIIVIKRKLKAIESAMSNPDRRESARELDDVFRN